MNELARSLSIEKIVVDDVFWQIENINSAQLIDPVVTLEISTTVEDPQLARAQCEFELRDDSKSYFKCRTHVYMQSKGADFNELQSAPATRRFTEALCMEMAMGQARSLLMHACALAGLAQPLLLSGVVSSMIELDPGGTDASPQYLRTEDELDPDRTDTR
ncbi:hypothetical protein E7T09_04605 [Deinococcus sp. KSM4-11]|uniref:hypothetical protein n=1 Tax=Deinococcus sp. KSM4-11 TaxID=2568654 RepID=UPI0010A553B4|nr:hypothetical protein [Deinococcus sp. KSM4-11]THF88492.1 hypothetical protein E7T09_04605 [Deinococcus sp. KSM4-11]